MIRFVSTLLGGAVTLALVIAVYLFFPGSSRPIAWTPPVPPDPLGPYAPNRLLDDVERIPVAEGPEALAFDEDGHLYAGVADGRILKIEGAGRQVTTYAQTDGRPLGMAFDEQGSLYVADALRGLLKVRRGGEKVERIADVVDGLPLLFADDLARADDGKIYLSDASFRHGPMKQMAEVVESRPNGRLIEFDPATGDIRTLLSGLYFANGVAVSKDQSFLLVNETTRYRIRRYWRSGPLAGTDEIFIDNLPGFPDNVRVNEDGSFWVALFSPRLPAVDSLMPYPFLRRALLRLPATVQPKPAHYGYALRISATGEPIESVQGETYAPITTVVERGGYLYLGSLTEDAIGRVAAP